MRCSIIIPCWNEEGTLHPTVAAARLAMPDSEIIVCDANSRDASGRIAAELGCQVVQAERRQRAWQMNLGAGVAAGEIFLFLHADTLLPRGAGEALRRATSGATVVGGGFARRFQSRSIFLAATCLLAEARCRAFGWFLGDQAIFVRRESFQELGGWADLDRFEDLDLARRMRRVGRTVTLRPPVISSARRFEREGPFRQSMRDFALTMRYLKGDPAATRVGTVNDHGA